MQGKDLVIVVLRLCMVHILRVYTQTTKDVLAFIVYVSDVQFLPSCDSCSQLLYSLKVVE